MDGIQENPLRRLGLGLLAMGLLVGVPMVGSVLLDAPPGEAGEGEEDPQRRLALVVGVFAAMPGLLLYAIGELRTQVARLDALRGKLPASEFRVVAKGGPGGTDRIATDSRRTIVNAVVMLALGAFIAWKTGETFVMFGWGMALSSCLAVLARARRAKGSIAGLSRSWADRHRELVDDAEAFCKSDAPADKREARAKTGVAEIELLELLVPGTLEKEAQRVAWFRAAGPSAKVAEALEAALAVEDEKTRAHRLAGVRRMAKERELTDADLALAGVVDPRTGEALKLESLG